MVGLPAVSKPHLMFAALDLLTFVLTIVALFMKGRLRHFGYLSYPANRIYLLAILLSLITSSGYFLVALKAFLQIPELGPTFKEALLTIMRSYPSGSLKHLLDRIQFKYSCCGAYGPMDWFLFDWYDRGDKWTNDDVPYSCCSGHTQIPCLHLNLKRSTFYVNYNVTTPTIWTQGCLERYGKVYIYDLVWLVCCGFVICLTSFSMSLMDRSIMQDGTLRRNSPIKPSLPEMEELQQKRKRARHDRKRSTSPSHYAGSSSKGKVSQVSQTPRNMTPDEQNVLKSDLNERRYHWKPGSRLTRIFKSKKSTPPTSKAEDSNLRKSSSLGSLLTVPNETMPTGSLRKRKSNDENLQIVDKRLKKIS